MEHNTLLDPLFELNGAFHKDKQVILLIVKYPALLGLHVFSSFMMVYVPWFSNIWNDILSDLFTDKLSETDFILFQDLHDSYVDGLCYIFCPRIWSKGNSILGATQADQKIRRRIDMQIFQLVSVTT